jgi:hypothetical protein
MPESLLIKCGCHTHLIEITKFKNDTNTYFTFWGYTDDKYPWSYRLKMIWNLLTKGRESIQEFVLLEENKQDLINYLNQN